MSKQLLTFTPAQNKSEYRMRTIARTDSSVCHHVTSPQSLRWYNNVMITAGAALPTANNTNECRTPSLITLVTLNLMLKRVMTTSLGSCRLSAAMQMVNGHNRCNGRPKRCS